MKVLERILSQNPVFAALSGAERELIAYQAVQKKIDKGETLAHYGDV